MTKRQTATPVTAYIHVTKYAEGFAGPEIITDSEVYRAFGLRHQAAVLKAQAEQLEQEAYDVLAAYHLVTGATTMKLPGVGGIELFQGSQSRLDMERFVGILATDFGVPADNIRAAREAATKVTNNAKVTVKFKPEQRQDK